MSLNILCVDDDPDGCESMAIILKMADHTVKTANSLEEAQRQIDADPPDVLVTDYHLGNRTGTELIRYARNKRQDIRTIIVTGGMAREGVKEDITGTKPGAVLQKPVDFDQLIAAVSRE